MVKLTIRCARSAVKRFARETVEVAAIPAGKGIVWLPKQKMWVTVEGVVVLKDGEAFMEGLGVLRDDDEGAGFSATQSTYTAFVTEDPFAKSHRPPSF